MEFLGTMWLDFILLKQNTDMLDQQTSIYSAAGAIPYLLWYTHYYSASIRSSSVPLFSFTTEVKKMFADTILSGINCNLIS